MVLLLMLLLLQLKNAKHIAADININTTNASIPVFYPELVGEVTPMIPTAGPSQSLASGLGAARAECDEVDFFPNCRPLEEMLAV